MLKAGRASAMCPHMKNDVHKPNDTFTPKGHTLCPWKRNCGIHAAKPLEVDLMVKMATSGFAIAVKEPI
jgi:hypothetical protein